ncbi:hypothetical protein ACE0DR_24195 [Azotobacter sp. CWF10]
MPGWSSAQLRVLGWLALATVLGTLVIMLLSFGGLTRVRGVALYANWLGLLLVLLGNYLLLRLKGFAEARFAARGLGWPVWLSVALGLLLEVAALLFEAGPLASWQAWLYAAGLIGYGGLLVWLGVRLLAVPEAFKALYGAGWLMIAGGSCWPLWCSRRRPCCPCWASMWRWRRCSSGGCGIARARLSPVRPVRQGQAD